MVSEIGEVSKFGSSIFANGSGFSLSFLGGHIATDLVVCVIDLETVFHVLHGVFDGRGGADVFRQEAYHGALIIGPIIPSSLRFLAIVAEVVESLFSPPFFSSDCLDVVHQLALGLGTLLFGQHSKVGVVCEPGKLEGLFSLL